MNDREAERIINPDTTAEAFAETEYYGGFEGKKKWKAVVDNDNHHLYPLVEKLGFRYREDML